MLRSFVVRLREGLGEMTPLAETILNDEQTYSGSIDAIETVRELERRQEMVEAGKSKLIDGDEHLSSILSSRQKKSHV